MNKAFAQQTEEISANHWESAFEISFQVLPSSIISQEDEVLQDEEITKSSTNSIQNQTHFVATLEIFEKFDVSCFHGDTSEKNIQNSIVEKLSFHPTESSTNSIRNQTHFAVALYFFEKFDVSCFHAATPEEEIRTSTIEELSTKSLTLIGLNSKIQVLPVMLVNDLINFCEKNQEPQGSFKIVVADPISIYS